MMIEQAARATEESLTMLNRVLEGDTPRVARKRSAYTQEIYVESGRGYGIVVKITETSETLENWQDNR